MFEEHQLISFTCVTVRGFPILTPLARSLDTFLQAAKGKSWGEVLVEKGLEKGEHTEVRARDHFLLWQMLNGGLYQAL